MNAEEDRCGNAWPQESPSSVDELVRRFEEFRHAGETLAWRGQARSEWQLESTLDRRLREIAPEESHEEWLARERGMLERFQSLAKRYASESELPHLRDTWAALAFGRHSGLPTRLLDWTGSPWVAVWFACHEHSDVGGAVWWFNQSQLEGALHGRWVDWGVPDRACHRGIKCLTPKQKRDLKLDQRALEATAFSPDGRAWVTKLHCQLPFSRMAAQQAFVTVCGRLRKTHNKAIDEIADGSPIKRGRIVIPARLKAEVLDMLRGMNIHATSLEYPGVDIVARRICP